MIVRVDDEQCGGHGVCVSLCPEVFALSDDGYAVAVDSVVPSEFEEIVRTAVIRCPALALTIS